MEKEQNNSSLPDISGVFDIDDSNIPADILAGASSAPERPRDYEPILLTDPVQEKLKKKELKKLKTQRKEEKKAKKRKKRRKRALLILLAAAFAAAAALGIKFAVDYSRRPVCETVRSYTSSISGHYDTKALLTSDVSRTGELITAALFSENDYDIYSVTKGLPAKITVDESNFADGTVTDIRQETSDSPVMDKIRSAFPDGEYSSGINYVITVQTDMTVPGQEDMIADISVITAQADNAVIVPTSAVHKLGTGFYVWIFKPFTKTAVKQEVSVGIESDGFSEITKGLKTDTAVVSVFGCPEEELTDTMKIKLKSVP